MVAPFFLFYPCLAFRTIHHIFPFSPILVLLIYVTNAIFKPSMLGVSTFKANFLSTLTHNGFHFNILSLHWFLTPRLRAPLDKRVAIELLNLLELKVLSIHLRSIFLNLLNVLVRINFLAFHLKALDFHNFRFVNVNVYLSSCAF